MLYSTEELICSLSKLESYRVIGSSNYYVRIVSRMISNSRFNFIKLGKSDREFRNKFLLLLLFFFCKNLSFPLNFQARIDSRHKPSHTRGVPRQEYRILSSYQSQPKRCFKDHYRRYFRRNVTGVINSTM